MNKALQRWLVFGPSIFSKSPAAHAQANKRNRRKFKAKVTPSGGPAAPGLFKHKTWTAQGNLMIRRKGKRMVVGKNPRKRR